MPSLNSPGPLIRDLWRRLGGVPGGRMVFGFLFGRLVPYASSIRPHFLALSEGHAAVRMEDRQGVRNHLQSIHAIALVNLAEMTTGLALASLLPEQWRSILVGLSAQFVKKARGPVTASCDITTGQLAEDQDLPVEVVVRDASGEVVLRATVTWRVGRSRA